MAIFSKSDFNKGAWAGPLARALREKNIIPDRHPKARLYRRTWTHWIQIEPKGFSGPAYWLGKPAVMARSENLYAGYYVERGYHSHRHPEYVITPEWHWHAFQSCLAQSARRTHIDSLIRTLDPAIRALAVFCGDDRLELAYQDEHTLTRAAEYTRSCPPSEWIDLFLGVRLPRDECLARQGAIRNRLEPALIRGREIEEVVLEAREELLSHRT